jgi:hypothetical protein
MATLNNFNNIADITPVAMDVLENMLVLTKHVNRGYDDSFKQSGRIGDTANIRVPGYYTYRRGAVANPQGYNDSFVPVTLNQGGVDIKFTSKELLLNVDDFKKNVLEPAMVPIATAIDGDGAALFTTLPDAAGIPGTAPTDLSTFLNAGALMADYAVPLDSNRAALVNNWSQASMVNGMKTLFNPIKDISRQYQEGNMGELAAGFKFSMTQQTPIFTTGVFGTSTPIFQSIGAGLNTINVSGMASGASTWNKGDIVTIAGVYNVNPTTKATTGQLKQFVVTATTTDTSGTFLGLPIYPAMVTSGPLQNVTALPVQGALVYFWGANNNTMSGKVSPTNCVFHRDAFLLACADLPKVGPSELCTRIRHKRLNFTMRMIKFYDGISDQQIYRLDVLYGWAKLRTGFAIRNQG